MEGNFPERRSEEGSVLVVYKRKRTEKEDNM